MHEAFGPDGAVVGYHSNRRTPERGAIARVIPLYEQLLAEERRQAGKAEQIAASSAVLAGFLADKGVPYDELVF